MKMLLVSTFQNVYKLLISIDPNLKEKTITYIPTAGAVEKLGFFVKIGKWKLKRLGFVIDEVDISTSSYDKMSNSLLKNDYIYVSGGNTFFLLQELKRTGADKLLVQAIKSGTFYIGESAGAIIVAPDITYSDDMDCKEKAPALKDYTGLGLTHFYPLPHYKHCEMGKSADIIIKKYSTSLDLKVIDDNQAIFVDGDIITILDK